jgi:hypothetical protein
VCTTSAIGSRKPAGYDTRFFLAAAPPHQQPSHDGSELVHHVWITPADALDRHRRGEINLMFPTVKTLEALAQLNTVNAAIDYARTPRLMPPMEPRLGVGREGKKLLVPGDYAYAEVGKLDPEQKGTASYDITPGVVIRLSEHVCRLTAPNPGVMTGPGTNTYLIGNADTGIAVIDPGRRTDPLDPLHAYPSGSLSRRALAEGAYWRRNLRHGCNIPGQSRRQLCAGHRKPRRRCLSARRVHPARAAYAGPRL